MNEQYLRGVLAYKGERGYSAYEIACKNGFIGSEKDWLATLGTNSHYDEFKIVLTATAKQTSFDLPEYYTEKGSLNIYINGVRLTPNEYALNLDTNKIELVGLILDEGTVVELVVQAMTTNNLPIVENINESSTNDTAPGTKAVYDYFKQFINTIYPVGSIYMSVNETSPETLFGGTWEQIKDTFLLGAGDTYAAGSTGGEATHKLELNELPNHRHGVANYNENGYNIDRSPVLIGETQTGWEGSVFTSYEGGGVAHNNMPPYLTVHIWKRVS